MPKISQPIYLIVENIRSMHNVGAFFRTADAFQIDKIFLCGYTAVPPRQEITKVALGAEETVVWEQRKDVGRLIRKLKSNGVQVVGLELTEGAADLQTFKPAFPVALIVGNEVEGIKPATLRLVDKIVKIPMRGSKESLNVSVAAGIALYALDLKRQRNTLS